MNRKMGGWKLNFVFALLPNLAGSPIATLKCIFLQTVVGQFVWEGLPGMEAVSCLLNVFSFVVYYGYSTYYRQQMKEVIACPYRAARKVLLKLNTYNRKRTAAVQPVENISNPSKIKRPTRKRM